MPMRDPRPPHVSRHTHTVTLKLGNTQTRTHEYVMSPHLHTQMFVDFGSWALVCLLGLGVFNDYKEGTDVASLPNRFRNSLCGVRRPSEGRTTMCNLPGLNIRHITHLRSIFVSVCWGRHASERTNMESFTTNECRV